MLKIFCKHKWQTKEKVIFESCFEQFIKHFPTVKPAFEVIKLEFFRKKVVIVLCCDKCGQVRIVDKESF